MVDLKRRELAIKRKEEERLAIEHKATSKLRDNIEWLGMSIDEIHEYLQ